MGDNWIRVLIDIPFHELGRCSDMVWFAFGKTFEVTIGDKKQIKSEYNLHLQCPWRLKDDKGALVIASNDIYQINSQMTWIDTFEWNVKGENLFDEKLSGVLEAMRDSSVHNIKLTTSNDLIIMFSNKYILEVFIDSTSDEEAWRFFKTNSKPHYVVSGKGINI